jgi:RNA polymerase primary sigma factor
MTLETCLSLESPVHGADGPCFKDQLADRATADVVDRLSVAGWLAEMPEWLDVLTPMECQILRWRFGLDASEEMTLREIGERYGYSRERVRQLEERALVKIRRRIEERHGFVPKPDDC